MAVEAIIPAVKGGADSFIQGLFTPIITIKSKKVRHTKKRDITSETQLNINGMDIAIGGAVLTAAMLFGVVGWKKHPIKTRRYIPAGADPFNPYAPGRYVETITEVTLPCAGRSGTFGGWNGPLLSGTEPIAGATWGGLAAGPLGAIIGYMLGGGKGP